MIPRDLEDLVLADSVGALDADEQAELAVRLGALPLEESMRLARLYDTAAALAMVVETLEPAAHLRDRVLDAARRGTPAATAGRHDDD